MIPQPMQMQDYTKNLDVSGVQPIFQNASAQEAMQRQMIQALQGQAQTAGQLPQNGFNPMAMAQMLRNQPASPYLSSLFNMARYGAGNVYGGFGQGQVPTMTTGMD